MVKEDRKDAQKRAAEIEALLNRHRVSLARDQKLVESWVPLSVKEREQARSGASQEASTSIDVLLRPELAGLGAEGLNGPELGANGLPTGGGGELEKLRKQLLVRKGVSTTTGLQSSKSRPAAAAQDQKKAINANGKRSHDSADEESDSDEGGRAASFKSKRAKKPAPLNGGDMPAGVEETETEPESAVYGPTEAITNSTHNDGSDTKQADDEGDASSDTSHKDEAPTLSKPLSILDQVIAERKKKKKKKKNKKKKQQEANGA